MKRIVVATDFSANSLNAVNYAADMAASMSANLIVIHVCVIPFAMSELPVSYDADRREKDARVELDSVCGRLVARTGRKIAIHYEVRRGDVLSEIKDYCEMTKPYVVVMGTEGIAAIERGLFGGKTLEGIRELQWPLIIVPPDASFKSISKIGLACDLKDVVESVRVDEIKSIVDDFDAELHVLHVSSKSKDEYSNATIEESVLLQQLFGELHPTYHFVKENDVEKALGRYAAKNKLDLLIIIPKRHNILDTIFHHRHSKSLVLETHIPLMSLHE